MLEALASFSSLGPIPPGQEGLGRAQGWTQSLLGFLWGCHAL